MEFEIVDLDERDVRDAKGRRVTQSTIDGLVEAVAKAKAGRPSLSAPGRRSPSVTLRFSEVVNAQLDEYAGRHGLSKSQVVRDAVAAYLTDAA
ncbi:MAG: ribbon-helix-helix domain-containing protein [Propionibacteriaceae bacterium]|jgi:hypothetical protein|nr:ribbon-helix-helix domain-containing protein [Propionibacteriaceae bacterium]